MRGQLLFVVGACLLLLVGCKGNTVDRSAPTFVDRGAGATVDVSIEREDDVTIADDIVELDASVQGNGTANQTVSSQAATYFPHKDVVQLYVANAQGVERLLIAEGAGAGLQRLRVSVQVILVGESDGEVVAKVSVNGKPLPALAVGEEASGGGTRIIVRDIILQS